jgi:hypothetical protein
MVHWDVVVRYERSALADLDAIRATHVATPSGALNMLVVPALYLRFGSLTRTLQHASGSVRLLP